MGQSVTRTVRTVIAFLFVYAGVASGLLLVGIEMPFAISLYQGEPASAGRTVIQTGVAVALIVFGIADLLRVGKRGQGPVPPAKS